MCTKFLKKIIIQVQKGTPTPSEKTKKTQRFWSYLGITFSCVNKQVMTYDI